MDRPEEDKLLQRRKNIRLALVHALLALAVLLTFFYLQVRAHS